jgi:hypothetical protein
LVFGRECEGIFLVINKGLDQCKRRVFSGVV